MDTSEQYIKLCEKAAEIQALVKPISFYQTWVHNDEYMTDHEGRFWSKDSPYIWLPRQDQLQEMVSNSLEAIMWMPTIFYWGEQDWYHPTEYASQFWTAEQLWLAFVMERNYQKRWVNNDWIKE